MGLRGLNRFLRANCQKNIRQISLWELKGKTIAVDASIYMYRFQGDGGLIEGMYQMVSLMRHNGIIPIFVFDGIPPPEKRELIEKRKQDKKEAERKFKEIKGQIAASHDEDDVADLEAEADQLRRQFVRITGNDIVDVKNLLHIMGISYYESIGESDNICVKMVQKKVAFACLSEDMDMFIYGCPRVLRYLSLLKSSVVMYHLAGILTSLHLPFDSFRDICVLSGTDYNLLSEDCLDLNKALKLYSKYSKARVRDTYIQWIANNNYIKDLDAFINVTEMFNMQNVTIDRCLMNTSIYDTTAVKMLLSGYGFVFPQ
uniref:XPG N-terminal domain-containing protein n=1 Tax=viral metagenome TaxID=1070528 RepID=A0A6C0LK74_9ZZZZ